MTLSLIRPRRAASVPVEVETHGPFTAFDRGWLLVQRADADKVQTLWEQEGFTLTHPEEDS